MSGWQEPQSGDEWERLADAKLAAARAIADAGGPWSELFDLSGLAVECALKAYIWRLYRWNRCPERGTRLYKQFRTKLPGLLRLAGLEETMKGLVNDTHPVGVSWLVIKDWNHNGKYWLDIKQRRAEDAFEAAASASHGVVAWLRSL